jgi:hypothetical protein
VVVGGSWLKVVDGRNRWEYGELGIKDW